MPFFRDEMKMEMKRRLVMKAPPVVRGMRSGNAFGAACLSMKP